MSTQHENECKKYVAKQFTIEMSHCKNVSPRPRFHISTWKVSCMIWQFDPNSGATTPLRCISGVLPCNQIFPSPNDPVDSVDNVKTGSVKCETGGFVLSVLLLQPMWKTLSQDSASQRRTSRPPFQLSPSRLFNGFAGNVDFFRIRKGTDFGSLMHVRIHRLAAMCPCVFPWKRRFWCRCIVSAFFADVMLSW